MKYLRLIIFLPFLISTCYQTLAQQVDINNKYFVFVNLKDYNKIYRYDLDSNKAVKVNNDIAENIILAGNKIFYRNYSDNRLLYSINMDGKFKRKLPEQVAKILAVSKDWILFTDVSERLHRLRLADYASELLISNRVWNAGITGGWVIYTEDLPQSHKLYRMRLNGSAKELISEDWVKGKITVHQGFVYYNIPDDDNTYMIDTNGQKKSVFFNQKTANFKIANNEMFYVNIGDNFLFKLVEDNTPVDPYAWNEPTANKLSVQLSDVPVERYFINQEFVYFLSKGTITKIRHDGSDKEIIWKNDAAYFTMPEKNE